MGQKVSPIGLRVGIIRDWDSRWYAEKDYAKLLHEDYRIRELFAKNYGREYMVSRIEIERTKDRVSLVVRTGRPGLFVSEKGDELANLKKKLEKLTNGKTIDIKLVQVANPDLDARLVAEKIAKNLEERQSFRTAQKKAIQQTMRSGAKGIKTAVSGRLGGADIARTEGYSEGVTPLHTLRSDIDYAWAEAMTTYGKLGVKVWICRGEVLPGQMVSEPEAPKQNTNERRKRNKRPLRTRSNKHEAENKAASEAVKEAEEKTEVLETKTEVKEDGGN